MKNMMTNEICLLSLNHFICSRMDRFYYKDTVEKLMTAQDSLRATAVRGSIQTAAIFNECKINLLF